MSVLNTSECIDVSLSRASAFQSLQKRFWLFSPAPATSVQKRRSLRVWLLVLSIILLSLGDLQMTLWHLTHGGMGEDNPVARYMIGLNSPFLLTLWKIASVTLASMIFILARTRRSGEVACWICLGILVSLTIRWNAYAAQSRDLQVVAGDPDMAPSNWVNFK